MTGVAREPVRKSEYFAALLEAAGRFPDDMTPTAVGVALALYASARTDGTHAQLSAPQVTRLFTRGQTSDRTAYKLLDTLKREGWIEVTKVGGRRGNKVFSSIYRLTRPVPSHFTGASVDRSNGGDAQVTEPSAARSGGNGSHFTDSHAPTDRGERGPVNSSPKRSQGRKDGQPSGSASGMAASLAAKPPEVDALTASGFWENDSLADLLAWLPKQGSVDHLQPGLGEAIARAYEYDLPVRGHPQTGDPTVDEALLVAYIRDRLTSDLHLDGRAGAWTLHGCRQALERLEPVLGGRDLAWAALIHWVERQPATEDPAVVAQWWAAPPSPGARATTLREVENVVRRLLRQGPQPRPATPARAAPPWVGDDPPLSPAPVASPPW